ncbi:hypothetical protein BKA83DRAFT_4131074 [Pisolithus microcarpus]|nr:hypothetical protein BKA83DRAFT_4131074 [Pisolithus microcarpus]
MIHQRGGVAEGGGWAPFECGNLYTETVRGMPGYEQGMGFLFYNKSPTTPSCFKIHHTLFEHISNENEDQCPLDMAKLPSSPFYFNFELSHKEMQEELYPLQKTHCMLPLCAHGLDGYIMSPVTYKKNLKNVIIKLHFNLWHWPISPKNGSQGKHSFTAKIVAICVLILPPTPVSSSLQKRKIPGYLDLEKSINVSKKRETWHHLYKYMVTGLLYATLNKYGDKSIVHYLSISVPIDCPPKNAPIASKV